MIHKLHQYHLVRRLRQQVSDRSEQVAFREWSPEGEKQLNWQQIDEHVTRISTALLSLGLQYKSALASLLITVWRGHLSIWLFYSYVASVSPCMPPILPLRRHISLMMLMYGFCLSASNPNLMLPSRCNLSVRNWPISLY